MINNTHVLAAAAAFSMAHAACAQCAIGDSAGQPVTSGSGLRWQRLCTGRYSFVRPAPASTGPLIGAYQQWFEDFTNRSKPGEHVSVPPCAPSGTAGIHFVVPPFPKPLDPTPDALPSRVSIEGNSCAIRPGTSLAIPAFSLMGIGNCEANMALIEGELGKHTEHYGVFVDGERVPATAFWRNETRRCFAFDSPMTGMTVQVNGGAAMPLANAYSDGFWTTIRFDEPGTYVLRMTQPPHRLYGMDRTLAREGSYIIEVRR